MTNPFECPAAKGQPPYWARPWDGVAADTHLRLLKQQQGTLAGQLVCDPGAKESPDDGASDAK